MGFPSQNRANKWVSAKIVFLNELGAPLLPLGLPFISLQSPLFRVLSNLYCPESLFYFIVTSGT